MPALIRRRAYIAGLLGVYELNRVELLRDVFVWAYERSCQRYVAISQSLGQPDKFRLRFRNELTEVVSEIVRHLARPTVEIVTAARWTACRRNTWTISSEWRLGN